MSEPRYPKISDEVVLDWFSGARIEYDKTFGEESAEWEHGDVALAFSDIGAFGNDPRAQIVMHHVPDVGGDSAVGVSIEIDRIDAVKLIARLASWIEGVGIESRNKED